MAATTSCDAIKLSPAETLAILCDYGPDDDRLKGLDAAGLVAVYEHLQAQDAPAAAGSLSEEMRRLVVATQAEDSDVVAFYGDVLFGYAARILSDTVDAVIRHHVGPTPPTPGRLDWFARRHPLVDRYFFELEAVRQAAKFLFEQNWIRGDCLLNFPPLPRLAQARADRELEHEMMRQASCGGQS